MPDEMQTDVPCNKKATNTMSQVAIRKLRQFATADCAFVVDRACSSAPRKRDNNMHRVK